MHSRRLDIVLVTSLDKSQLETETMYMAHAEMPPSNNIRIISLASLDTKQTYLLGKKIAGCAVAPHSPVLHATGLVNGKGQFLTPIESIPFPNSKTFVTADYVDDPYTCTKFGANPSTGSFCAMGEI